MVQKYGTPSGTSPAHVALMSDMSLDDSHVHASLDVPTLEECTDDYDNKIEWPLQLGCIPILSCLRRNLSLFWVVDSSHSINLTTFHGDFVMFDSLLWSSRVGGVGVAVNGSGTVHIFIPLGYGHVIRRTIHALYTPS
jgi:hypothetical protein